MRQRSFVLTVMRTSRLSKLYKIYMYIYYIYICRPSVEGKVQLLRTYFFLISEEAAAEQQHAVPGARTVS